MRVEETDTIVPEDDVAAIIRGRHPDPFAVLGMHGGGGRPLTVAVFAPEAGDVAVVDRDGGTRFPLARTHKEGFFAGRIAERKERFDYLLEFSAGDDSWQAEDPFRFGPVLGELDEHLLAEGNHRQLYRQLGAQKSVREGISGISFAVWAPSAQRVSVVGDFNAWDGRRHPMRKRLGPGVWEIFVPGLGLGEHYKFEIVGPDGNVQPLKADPVSFFQQSAPETASITHGMPDRDWGDGDWMRSRGDRLDTAAPISIYEVHLGSWRLGSNGEALDYGAIADQLVDYVQQMGFTHVELLPITEHPFVGSWGYQPIGLYAPTSRFGPPEAFADFVDRLHQAGIGVIMDWVPAHFPSDAYGLARFDGTALYEHEDPRLGFHQDWNTLIYNFGRVEVANFLRANALFWLGRYHIDGLRVDAVASMLYLDYSRKPGEWIPNRYGGNENIEAIEFLRSTNALIGETHPGVATIAEESTAWPGVSRPADAGGLGFNYKWNMGWMHDTLDYMSRDPIHRRHHHHQMTFGIHYGFSENFVLPISHDEVVHGKGSLIGKMPGDRWQKFANLRAYLGFMWTHPGKKLLFMGSEFAQEREWNHDRALDWHLLDDPAHAGISRLVADLNRLYRSTPSLHERDCDPAGFEWVEGGDVDRNVFAYLRKGTDPASAALVVCNMSPTVWRDYRVGVPQGGTWREVLNTDAEHYGGSNVGNAGRVTAEAAACHGRADSLSLVLPPLATLVLVPEN